MACRETLPTAGRIAAFPKNSGKSRGQQEKISMFSEIFFFKTMQKNG